MIECCEDSENIDLKEQFQRVKVYESIQKRTTEASGKHFETQEIAQASLRKKYGLKEIPKDENYA